MTSFTLSVNRPQNLTEDLYNAVIARGTTISSNRPYWNLNITVDQIAFYVGAIGSVGLGYALNQYEPPNIDNIDYINNSGEERRNFFINLARQTVLYPISIVKRFFIGGALYVLVGFATHNFLKRGRPLAAGVLTSLYFSFGNTSLVTMLKTTVTFATFALVMEELYQLALK